MSCNGIPLSCLDPSKIFAGIYNPNCGGFGDPSNFKAEQAVLRSSYSELINNYGVNINYYIYSFNLSAMNMLYGEHTLAKYADKFTIKAYVELTEGFSITSYGAESSDELVIYISIDDFVKNFITLIATEDGKNITDELGNRLTIEGIQEKFYRENGQRIEPKSDDLIEITALGCDRPGNRGAKIFRISEVVDQDVSGGLNPMMGHYVWRITATRYETSFETNAPMEIGNDQVYDNDFSGKETSSLFPSLTTTPKVYPFDIDVISKETVYDMSKNDNGLYGDYY